MPETASGDFFAEGVGSGNGIESSPTWIKTDNANIGRLRRANKLARTFRLEGCTVLVELLYRVEWVQGKSEDVRTIVIIIPDFAQNDIPPLKEFPIP